MPILDDILGDRDLSKVGSNRVNDELDAVLFKDEPQASTETPAEPVAPSEDTPTPEPQNPAPEPTPEPVEPTPEPTEETPTEETPTEEPKDDTENELNQIFDDLFGTKEESDASTGDLGDKIKATGDEDLITAFEKMQSDLQEKDAAIESLRKLRDEDTNSSLIQDAEIAKLSRVVDVVSADDDLKAIVAYMSQVKDKPELKSKLEEAVTELYKRTTGVDIDALKGKAEMADKSKMSATTSGGVMPNVTPVSGGIADELGQSLGI